MNAQQSQFAKLFELSRQEMEKYLANMEKQQKCFTKLFYGKLAQIDKSLEDYKKENNIQVPIYQKYICVVWLVPPYSKDAGLYYDPKTPSEITEQYKNAYNSTLLEL